MMPSDLVQTATDVIGELQAQAEVETINEPHVVMCRDPLVGTMPKAVYGPFPNAVEALAYAEVLEKDVNRGQAEGEPPWEVAVAPIYPPAHERGNTAVA